MPTIRLNLLGPFEALQDSKPVADLRSSRAQALLIYLAVERSTTHRREHLFTMLWPGMPEKSARHNLSQTLYTLRQTFPDSPELAGKELVPLMIADRQSVQINLESAVEIDIEQFDQLLKETRVHDHFGLEKCEACIQSMERTATLYRGDFLEDFYLEDSSQFEEWAEAVRESYRSKVLETLQTLTDIAINQGDYERARKYAERQFVIDKLKESAHRQLMEILARGGRRAEALRQYRNCVQILEDELGVTPSQETQELYVQIQSQDLASRPPQLEPSTPKTVTPRHNLPIQPTPFIGREQELDQLDQMLSDPYIRLITIVAPGGMGKTRLAIACGERQLEQNGKSGTYTYQDGIFFVSLAPLAEPDQIVLSIANALNLPLEGGSGLGRTAQTADSTLEKLTGFLHNKQTLLILDNFEHLIDGAEHLSKILQVAPSVKILVTARERLHLQEEQLFPLQGLVFPDWEAPETPGDYTAMELFIQSANRVRPDFVLAPGDMTYLTRICSVVGGMPLALELAAAWVDLLSPAEIITEIQGSLDFLESDLRNLPERHRSMRAICDSTWRRLSDAEQSVFQRLSVFRGGFDRAAAQDICGAGLHDLGSLGSKALIQYDPSTERYQIHEILRQFGAEKLAESSENEEITRNRHSEYYCNLIQQLYNAIVTGKTYLVLTYSNDLANMQTGWEWAIRQEHFENLYKAILGMVIYFDIRLQVQKSLACCQSAIKLLERKGIVDISITEISDELVLPLRLNALALAGRGYCNFFFDHTRAKEDLTRSLITSNKLLEKGWDARFEKALALWFLGLFELQFGKQNAAYAYGIFSESLALSREIEHTWLSLYILIWVGIAARWSGNLDEAQQMYEQLLSEAREQEHPGAQIWALRSLADLFVQMNDFDQAKSLYEQGWEVAHLSNEHLEGIEALTALGHLMLFLGKLGKAIEIYNQGIDLAVSAGLPEQTVNLLASMGVAQYLRYDFTRAGAAFEKSLAVSKQNVSNLNFYAIICNAEYLAINGAYLQGKEQLQVLMSLPEKTLHERYMAGPYLSGRFRQTLGWITLGQKQYDRAASHFTHSIETFSSISKNEGTACSQAGLARTKIGLGNWEAAQLLLQEAIATAIKIQAYVPLVFILPVTLLCLVEEDLEFATKVYTQVRKDGFMSNAQLFHDLVYKHLPDEITSISVETVEHSDEHRETLWNTARLVLAYWSREQ